MTSEVSNESKEDIFFWTRHDKHGYCSNFYRSPVVIDSILYPTVEHYYQSQKTLNLNQAMMVRNCKTPKDAKFAGYYVSIRPGWEDLKEEVMLVGLRAKFTQHPGLAEKLLGTGDSIIHEDSPRDKYWGHARGEGKDRLGVLLIQVRGELREVEKIDRTRVN